MSIREVNMSSKADSKSFRMFSKDDILEIIRKEQGRFFLQKDSGHFIVLTSKRGVDEKLVIVITPDRRRKMCVVTQRHIHETDPREEDNFMEIEEMDRRLFN